MCVLIRNTIRVISLCTDPGKIQDVPRSLVINLEDIILLSFIMNLICGHRGPLRTQDRATKMTQNRVRLLTYAQTRRNMVKMMMMMIMMMTMMASNLTWGRHVIWSRVLRDQPFVLKLPTLQVSLSPTPLSASGPGHIVTNKLLLVNI